MNVEELHHSPFVTDNILLMLRRGAGAVSKLDRCREHGERVP